MHEAAVLQDAQDLGLHVHGHGADLVEEECAAVGYFEEAFFCGDRRGEGAFYVAEEGGLQQVRGDGAGVDGDEGACRGEGICVDGLGDELFAGAALALDEDGGTAGGDLGDEVEEPQHWLALADDVFEVVALLEGALELDDLFFGAVPGDGGADVGEEFFVVPGLLDEVLGAGTDGIDDVADRAEGGDHDDGKLGLRLDDARQEIDAALAGECEIEQERDHTRFSRELETGGCHPRPC